MSTRIRVAIILAIVAILPVYLVVAALRRASVPSERMVLTVTNDLDSTAVVVVSSVVGGVHSAHVEPGESAKFAVYTGTDSLVRDSGRYRLVSITERAEYKLSMSGHEMWMSKALNISTMKKIQVNDEP